MIKRFLSESIVEEEWPLWRLVMGVFALILLSIFGFSIYFFGPTLDQIRGETVTPTALTRDIRIEVGGTLFSIPANYTRYGHDRSSYENPFVELHALLPDLSGFQAADETAFADLSNQSRLLLFSLSEIEGDMTPQRLWKEVFVPQIGAFTETVEYGLKSAPFKSGSLYRDATYYQPETMPDDGFSSPFIICAPNADGAVWCQGRLTIGRTAQAIFRFPQNYLSDWKLISNRLAGLLSRFRAEARRPS